MSTFSTKISLALESHSTRGSTFFIASKIIINKHDNNYLYIKMQFSTLLNRYTKK